MSSFWTYMIGIAVIAGALGYGAHLLGVPATWLGIGVAVVIGLGIIGAVRKSSGNNTSQGD